ncbi:MAG: recombination protein RecR [Spirochaetes bacterium GWF1_41_5]|nr:MAG: recombination protein RecR [Spirochaetes bacterium GWF1_41_5]HBE01280.1 recombination protein RecR [Spirochaetia bacterium]
MASLFQRAIFALKKLPGVGERMAERIVFRLAEMSENDVLEIADALCEFRKKIRKCEICGVISEQSPCRICSSSKRQRDLICVVEKPQDALVIEKGHFYKGLYHVLGGLLSPLKNISEENLRISELSGRTETGAVKEIIIALDQTVEGDATASLLYKMLVRPGIIISRLAGGMPSGIGIDSLDERTLKNSLQNRISPAIRET